MWVNGSNICVGLSFGVAFTQIDAVERAPKGARVRVHPSAWSLVRQFRRQDPDPMELALKRWRRKLVGEREKLSQESDHHAETEFLTGLGRARRTLGRLGGTGGSSLLRPVRGLLRTYWRHMRRSAVSLDYDYLDFSMRETARSEANSVDMPEAQTAQRRRRLVRLVLQLQTIPASLSANQFKTAVSSWVEAKKFLETIPEPPPPEPVMRELERLRGLLMGLVRGRLTCDPPPRPNQESKLVQLLCVLGGTSDAVKLFLARRTRAIEATCESIPPPRYVRHDNSSATDGFVRYFKRLVGVALDAIPRVLKGAKNAFGSTGAATAVAWALGDATRVVEELFIAKVLRGGASIATSWRCLRKIFSAAKALRPGGVELRPVLLRRLAEPFRCYLSSEFDAAASHVARVVVGETFATRAFHVEWGGGVPGRQRASPREMDQKLKNEQSGDSKSEASQTTVRLCSSGRALYEALDALLCPILPILARAFQPVPNMGLRAHIIREVVRIVEGYILTLVELVVGSGSGGASFRKNTEIGDSAPLGRSLGRQDSGGWSIVRQWAEDFGGFDSNTSFASRDLDGFEALGVLSTLDGLSTDMLPRLRLALFPPSLPAATVSSKLFDRLSTSLSVLIAAVIPRVAIRLAAKELILLPQSKATNLPASAVLASPSVSGLSLTKLHSKFSFEISESSRPGTPQSGTPLNQPYSTATGVALAGLADRLQRRAVGFGGTVRVTLCLCCTCAALIKLECSGISPRQTKRKNLVRDLQKVVTAVRENASGNELRNAWNSVQRIVDWKCRDISAIPAVAVSRIDGQPGLRLACEHIVARVLTATP